MILSLLLFSNVCISMMYSNSNTNSDDDGLWTKCCWVDWLMNVPIQIYLNHFHIQIHHHHNHSTITIMMNELVNKVFMFITLCLLFIKCWFKPIVFIIIWYILAYIKHWYWWMNQFVVMNCSSNSWTTTIQSIHTNIQTLSRLIWSSSGS